MGTTARVVLYAKDETLARDAFAKAFRSIGWADHALSDYRDDGAVAALQAKGRGKHTVNPHLYAALQRAERIRKRTSGAFDVTVGPVVVLWRDKRVPTDDEIAAARKRMGGFVLHPDWRVELLADGIRFDFGGIGKGVAGEMALIALDGLGIDRALVDIGGDIALGRAPPGERGWVVQVADRQVELAECGVGASGPEVRGFTEGGVHYSHLIDPRTGKAVQHGHSVWVVAPDAVDADALASAYSVMSREEAVDHAMKSVGVHVVLEWDENGGRRRRASLGFPRSLPRD